MGEIRLAIIGVGNCASSIVQGLSYYSKIRDEAIGLMHPEICGYEPKDIKVVAAFDVDARKVGKPLEEAVFSSPNCTKVFESNIRPSGVKVHMGHPLDGISSHMKDYPENRTFLVSDRKPDDIVRLLQNTGAEILLNYLPVGAEEATRYYAECCLESGVSLINCIPVFIASDEKWAARFSEKGIPVVGDDVKSQIGATIIHRALAKLFHDRGVQIDRTYQLNTGGNTDFLNMLNRSRLISKKISKTEAVQSQLDIPIPPENIHIGPSDYVPWQNDNKVCFMRIEGRTFGDIPIDLELRLSVEDSPNSAGCMIDAIRCCKVARDRGIGGVLESVSAYTMKHPIRQFPDEIARHMLEEFIRGEKGKIGYPLISNRVGHSLDPAILKIYRFFFKDKTINPNYLTLFGAIFGYASAMCIAFGFVKTGGIILMFSGFFDLLDGALARSTNTVSSFGGFLDSVLDRYTDLFLMFGIFVLFLRQGQMHALVFTFVAAIGVAIIPYARARAEAASIECKAGLMERPERLLILLIGIFFNVLLYAVIVLAVLTHVTVIQRILFVRRNS